MLKKSKPIKINKLEKFARKRGADFFGIADLVAAKTAVIEQGGELVAGYPLAISMGISLLDTIVDELPNREQQAAAVNYKHHCYDIINNRLDLLASQVCSLLQNKGYRTLPVPASKRVDDEKICAIFSHKMAAYLAGLGWIGKSCLLITPKRGPRVRWVTVLTDAPFAPTGTPGSEQCGKCRECVDICPVNAFTGKPFKPEESREIRYDALQCHNYHEKIKKENDWAVCGLCLYVCPYGRKNQK